MIGSGQSWALQSVERLQSTKRLPQSPALEGGQAINLARERDEH